MPLPRLLKKELPSIPDVRKQEADLHDDRPLSDLERELLAHVLSHGSESARSFLAQVPVTKVISHCGCGCPTVGLEVDRTAARGFADERVIVDLLGLTPDQKQVGILIFADNGYLSLLEIYDLDELPRPYSLPTTAGLHEFKSSAVKSAELPTI